MSVKTKVFGLLASTIVASALCGCLDSGGSAQTESPDVTPVPPLVDYPTVYPTPENLGEANFIAEYAMGQYEYCADCYPQLAELFPPETPCANWENGGLQWFYLADTTDMKLGWGAVLWQGPQRFCGFPTPYPEKPAEAPEMSAPREWLRWREEQNFPTSTPTPEPTTIPPRVIFPTILPTPADTGAASFYPEYALWDYVYCSSCYPQFTALYPLDTPCANWENGGLQWVYLEDTTDMKLGWGAVVWQGPQRFCGFPWPYPEKPAEVPEITAPREWMRWRIEAEHSPSVTPEPTESP
jgi:hypothetical protein